MEYPEDVPGPATPAQPAGSGSNGVGSALIGFGVLAVFVFVIFLFLAEDEKPPGPALRSSDSTEVVSHPPALPVTPREPTYLPGEDEHFVWATGRIKVGMRLYDKRTHAPFGFVTAIESGRVEVVTVDSFETVRGSLRMQAVWFERSFIKDRCVTNR